jgi:single-stranded-DNA-specific exonuclease
MSLAADRLDDFRAQFLAEVARRRGASPVERTIEVDAVLGLAELTVSFADELARLGPFGPGNPEPLLAVAGVVAAETRVVGKGHLQMALSEGRARADAIGFNMADRDPGAGTTIDLLASADLDNYRGNRRARLRVKHLFRGEDMSVAAFP